MIACNTNRLARMAQPASAASAGENAGGAPRRPLRHAASESGGSLRWGVLHPHHPLLGYFKHAPRSHGALSQRVVRGAAACALRPAIPLVRSPRLIATGTSPRAPPARPCAAAREHADTCRVPRASAPAQKHSHRHLPHRPGCFWTAALQIPGCVAVGAGASGDGNGTRWDARGLRGGGVCAAALRFRCVAAPARSAVDCC